MEKVARRLTFKEAAEEDEKFWIEKTPQEKLTVLTKLRVGYHGGQRLQKFVQRVPHDPRA